jgi:hypothetical protein
VAGSVAALPPGAAAGEQGARPPSARVADARAAEARYRAFHAASIAPALPATERRRAEGLLGRSPAVERGPCRRAREGIAASGTPRALHGSLEALDRAGACWTLRWDGLLGVGLGAVVARDGTVLLAWWIPEG